MPLHTCPACGNLLTREEYESRDCPACRLSSPAAPSPQADAGGKNIPMEMVITREAPAPTAREEWLLPRSRPLPLLAWATARSGLVLVAVGALLMGASFMAEMATIKHLIRPQRYPEHLFLNIQCSRLFSNLLWGGGFFTLIGMGLCIRGPLGTGARWLAGTALACLVAALLLYMAGEFALAANQDYLQGERIRPGMSGKHVPEGETSGPPWGNAILQVMGFGAVSLVLGGNLLFGLFLWQMARGWRRPVLAGSLLAFLATAFVFQLVSVIIIGVEASPDRPDQTRFQWVIGGQAPSWIYLGGLGAILWFAAEVFWLRGVLSRELHGAEKK